MFGFGKASSDVHDLIPGTPQRDWLQAQKPWIHPEGVPWVADYAYGELPRNMPFLYEWFVVNIGETSKGSAMHFE